MAQKVELEAKLLEKLKEKLEATNS